MVPVRSMPASLPSTKILPPGIARKETTPGFGGGGGGSGRGAGEGGLGVGPGWGSGTYPDEWPEPDEWLLWEAWLLWDECDRWPASWTSKLLPGSKSGGSGRSSSGRRAAAEAPADLDRRPDEPAALTTPSSAAGTDRRRVIPIGVRSGRLPTPSTLNWSPGAWGALPQPTGLDLYAGVACTIRIESMPCPMAIGTPAESSAR